MASGMSRSIERTTVHFIERWPQSYAVSSRGIGFSTLFQLISIAFPPSHKSTEDTSI